MAGPNGAQAAPGPGAAPPRYPERQLTVLSCDHVRVIAASVPPGIVLWCPECQRLRSAAHEPYTPRQARELAAARWLAARDRELKLRALLDDAAAEEEAAYTALCAAELALATPGER